MLRRLHVENFKSIERLDFEPGRFNVLIGENGSGKSNVLEALAFAGGAVGGKLDNEFLVSRGVRVSETKFMRSAFGPTSESIRFAVETAEGQVGFRVSESSQDNYPRWQVEYQPASASAVASVLAEHFKKSVPVMKRERSEEIVNELLDFVQRAALANAIGGSAAVANVEATSTRVLETLGTLSVLATRAIASDLASFVAYSPEASALRTFEREGQILPLGIAGEGLFKLLQVLAADEKDPARWADLKENLRLLDWFESIDVPAASGGIQERSVRLRDRFIPPEMGYFDQRSANEAFLFILFYLALFVSSDTPALFGIDNIDASLNPKTCRELTRRLTHLAKKYDKQVVATTHNPAVLDGLDLNDDEQRLFVVRRGRKGDTKLRRVLPPKPVAGEQPLKLSEAFLRGLLGGLPQNF
jgi:predicted ATPase